MNISQRQATIFVLGFQLVAIIILGLSQFIAKPGTALLTVGAGLAATVYGGVLFAYLRGWEYARHASVVLITLIVAAFLPEPFVTTYAPFLILLGPILALVLINPRWVIGSAVATIGLLLLRAGGVGVYASMTTLLNYAMLIAGLVVSRMISDSTRLRAEQAEEALRRMHNELEIQFQQRTTALSQTNTLLETMLEYVPDQIYFKDAESRFIRNSKAQATALGLNNPTQAIGKTDFDFFPHAQRAYDEEQEIIRSGKPLVDFEEHVIWPDNSQTWISTTKMPLRDQAGQIIGTFGISRDITERKRNEEALRKAKDELETKITERTVELSKANEQLQLELTERKQAEEALRVSEARLNGIITSVMDAIISIDSEQRIMLFNPAAEVMFHCEQAEALGQPVETFLPERFRRSHRQHVQKFAQTGITSRRAMGQLGIVYVLRRTGEQFPIEASISQTLVAGKSIFTVILRDITARKRAEDELKRSNTELEQFAYVASHDLQEPLRAVAGMVQLLGQRYKGKLDERADEYIGHAVEASGRMQSLINDLLDYSRVDRLGKPFSSANLERSLDIALANLQLSIQENGAQITRDDMPTLMADASQLTQVFQNLIGNAIKFRGEGPPQIHISAEKLENGWRFAIRDNGIGIEPQYFERIFLVFQRLHTRREYSGTGIGLALCKKIVERHRGQIWVESQQEQGSTFYFTIPERVP